LNGGRPTATCNIHSTLFSSGHFLKGQSSKRRGLSQKKKKKKFYIALDNAVWMRYSVKEDSAGLDM